MNGIEADIIKAIQNSSSGFFDGFFGAVTELGGIWAVPVFAIVFLLLFKLRGTVRYLFILGAASTLGTVIKLLAARQRPYIFSSAIQAKTSASGFSFASGHTLTAVITALFIYFAVSHLIKAASARNKTHRPQSTTQAQPENKNRNKKNTCKKVLLAVILTAAVLLVGFSRVYLGVHYPSDVLFAILLGSVCYCAFALIYDKYIEKLIFGQSNKKEIKDAVHKQ